jgi:hypothetical protein
MIFANMTQTQFLYPCRNDDDKLITFPVGHRYQNTPLDNTPGITLKLSKHMEVENPFRLHDVFDKPHGKRCGAFLMPIYNLSPALNLF